MMSNLNDSFLDGPKLVWVIEPENKIRFRYASEGGSHGGLAGKAGKKTHPTLQLINYHGRKKVFVRVRLFTEDKKEHVLQFKGKKNEGCKQYVEEDVQDNEVVFKNLQILSKKKDEIEKILMERKLNNLKEDMSRPVRIHFEKTYQAEIKVRARAILNSVRLYFEAFEVGRSSNPICSLFSDVISNQKAAAKGDLRICRLSQINGSWKGGDEIILLCEKVQKDNIKVKFFETDEDGSVVWYDYGSFSPVDVHHQVAITFKTPPYKENVEKTVFICLERNGEESDSREFTYKSERPSCKKRKLESNHSASSENIESSETSVSSMNISSPESSSNDASSGMPNNFDLKLDFPIDDLSFSELPFNLDKYLSDEDLKLPFDLIDSPDDDYNMYDDDDGVDGLKAPTNQEHIVNHSLDFVAIDAGLRNLTLDEHCESKFKNLSKFKMTSELSKNSSSDFQRKNFINFLSKKDKYENTFLHFAVFSNRRIEPILKMCHISKIDLINVQNCRNQTALHLAVEKNEIKATEILLTSGSDPNIKDANGNNCYHIAARNGSIPVLQAIITHSKFSHNVDDCNDEGLTPMHIAIMQKKSYSLIQWLKIHLTNSNAMEKKAGRSLLHYAIDFQPSLLSRLLQMPKIDVDIQDFEGNTPLHIACACENVEAVKLLLQSGANPLLKNFKQNCNSLDQENSEDGTSDGQLPSDLTTNIEILELLSNTMVVKAVAETEEELPVNLPISVSSQDSDEMTVQAAEKLCKYLDEEMKWKRLAPFFLEPDVIDALSLSASPSRALLNFIKKEEQHKYLERLKNACEYAELNGALSILNEQS